MPVVKRIFGEKISIETRDKNNPMLYARWKKQDHTTGHRHVRISLNTKSLEEAEIKATEEYLKYTNAVNAGEDTARRKKTIEHVAIKWRDQLEKDLDDGMGKSIYPSYIGVVNNYLIPLLGNFDINNTSDADIKEYFRQVRIKFNKRDAGGNLQDISKSTINTHNSVINHVFELAVGLKLTTRSRCPATTSKGKGRKKEARPSFQKDEIPELLKLLDHRIKESPTSITKYKRELLLYYVTILYLTGMRTGTEAMNLQWEDIDMSKGYITIHKGKNISSGSSEGRTIPVGVEVIETLRLVQNLTKKNTSFVWVMFDGKLATGFSEMFGKLLDGTPLRVAQSGKYKGRNRSLYSLRHSFITERLLEGERDAVIMEYCDTSKEMIESYYQDINLDQTGRKLVEGMNVAPQLGVISSKQNEQLFDIAFGKFKVVGNSDTETVKS